MKEPRGIITLFVLVGLTSLLFLGTTVFYQAFYAYSAAIKHAQYMQQVYALEGLVNHGITLIRVAERAHAPLVKAVSQSYVPWLLTQARVYNGTLVITPNTLGYTLVAQVTQGTVQLNKTLKMSRNN